MGSVFINLAIYLSILYYYLPSVIPLLAITLTNSLLIIAAIWLVTAGKRYTRLNVYVDDDVRLSQAEDQANSSVNIVHYYLYIVRIYFVNFVHLENQSQPANDQFEVASLDEQDPNREESCMLIVELIDQNRYHATKLQLDLELLRKYYIRKFTLKDKEDDAGKNNKMPNRDSVSSKACYFVKFLFQRGRPLCNISYLRIRQLSSSFPLHLYRVEIQDSANESDAIVCHVNQPIDMQSKCYPSLFTKQYKPPFDRAFNSTKLIWDEMMLFLLLGLDILSLISLNLLNFYEHNIDIDHGRLYWTQILFGSMMPALVALALAASYRVFTKYKPQYRKITQSIVAVVLSTAVIILSLTCICWAIKHSLISHFELLRYWVEAYFISLGLYLFFCLLIVACDVGIFYNL